MISIVIPCYNACRYLPRLAETINEISPFASEILLVDDCSTDDTYHQAIALCLPIIQTHRNLGPGGARNFGVQHLSGKWVHFLDADDVLSADVLHQSLRYLDESVDVLLLGARWVDGNSGQLLREWAIQPLDVAADPLLYSFTSPIPTHCSLLRIEQFRAIGGFDSELRCWEDGDLHVRLAAHGARFTVNRGVLTTSIRHDRGASANHLYCHRCRLAFLKRYVQQQLQIETRAMASEFMVVGNLLLGESCYGEALEAYQLSHLSCPIQPRSSRALLRRLMAFLPPPWALLLQQWLRQTLGQYFNNNK